MKLQEVFAKKTYRDHRIPPELIDAVKQYAYDHYETDGWDYVVETMDDLDIAQEISDATTPEEAIAKMYNLVKELDDHRKEIQSTAF
jgi:spore coat polysaccharide biosynthesis protein SpsF (cytidylyltransferase family)